MKKLILWLIDKCILLLHIECFVLILLTPVFFHRMWPQMPPTTYFCSVRAVIQEDRSSFERTFSDIVTLGRSKDYICIEGEIRLMHYFNIWQECVWNFNSSPMVIGSYCTWFFYNRQLLLSGLLQCTLYMPQSNLIKSFGALKSCWS